MRISNFPAEIVGGNDYLLTLILLRLPAKPLLRFKSVSKQWLSLISSSQFSSLHTIRNPNFTISGLIYRCFPFKIVLLPLPSHSSSSSSSSTPAFDSFNTRKIKILQSCNGLLLCCSNFPEKGVPTSYYISNPTTNQLFTLPSVSSSSFDIVRFSLAFDPSRTSNYKVICVHKTLSTAFHHQILIYESEIGAWRLSGSPFEVPFDVVSENGVFWNGSIHWISRPTNIETLRFDVCRECIGQFPALPFTDGRGRRRSRYFGVSGGHLHLIEVYQPRSAQFKVYEINRDYSNWSVRYHVDLDLVVKEFPEMVGRYLSHTSYNFSILSVLEEENEEESLILIHLPV